MQQFLMRVWRRLRFPLLVSLALVPVPAGLTAGYGPALLHLVWVWPVGYLLLDVLGTCIRGRWRILHGVALTAILAAAAVWMKTQSVDPFLYTIPLMYLILLLVGLALSAEDRKGQSLLLGYTVAGVVVHLIAQLFLQGARAYGDPAAERIAPWLLVSFFLFVCLGLVMLNSSTLESVSLGRLQVSRIMQRKNILLTLALFAIALGAALIPAVVSAVTKLVKWFIGVMRWLFGLLDKLLPMSQSGVPQEEEIIDPVGENELLPWLEALLKLLILLMVVFAVILAAYYLIRNIKLLVMSLGRKMRGYLQPISEDYVDEITDTRKGDNHTERWEKKKKRAAADVRKLPPEQRIRYRYRLLMRRNPQWAAGSTARENLSDAAASIYERVRYSGSGANEEDARIFAEETKKV